MEKLWPLNFLDPAVWHCKEDLARRKDFFHELSLAYDFTNQACEVVLQHFRIAWKLAIAFLFSAGMITAATRILVNTVDVDGP